MSFRGSTSQFSGERWKTYEVYVPEDGARLVVDLAECSGSVHVYASTVFEHISNGVYDVQLRRFEGNFKMFGGKMLVAEQLKKGILYLGVKAVTD